MLPTTGTFKQTRRFTMPTPIHEALAVTLDSEDIPDEKPGAPRNEMAVWPSSFIDSGLIVRLLVVYRTTGAD